MDENSESQMTKVSGRSEDDELDVDKLIGTSEVQPSWPEQKDRRVTDLAIAVILGSAGTACISILAKTFCPRLGTVGGDGWEIDIITLALVASLSFVMGSNGSPK